MASATKRSWKLQDFVAHGSNVNCLALGHKSGRVLVTGGDDKKVNLWAVGKYNCIMSLSGHMTPVECVRFGHTEELVCAGSQSGALKIWDLEAAKLVRTLTGHKANIRCMDFHPYGDFLTSGSLDTSIQLWDIRRKGRIFTYKGHKLTVNSIKFSPDGQWIASGGEDGYVKLWDIRAGRLLKEFNEHKGPVTSVEFHPHEFLLASGSVDRTINFYDLENFHLVSTTDKENSAIRCIYFSQGGECLFAGSQDVLKVFGWEPARTQDTLHVGWSRIQDIATAQSQLIGASFNLTNVMLFVVDLNKVQPFGGVPLPNTSAFVHGQNIRKSFSRDKPLNVSKATLDVKTIEESDRSGTDPEDESHADILNFNDYKTVFQPSRILNRTPPPVDPFPAPEDDDPLLPQVLRSTSETEIYEITRSEKKESQPTCPQSSVSVSTPAVVVVVDEKHVESITKNSPPPPPPPKNNIRKYSTSKEPPHTSFSEVDQPVKLNNIRHSPSEPSLNRPISTHKRSNSFSRNSAVLNIVPPSVSSPEPHVLPPVPVSIASTYSGYSEKLQSTKIRSSKIQASPEKRKSSVISVKDNDRDDEDNGYIPMSSEKPSGLDLDDFLPRSYSRTFGYQQTFPDMSEAEVLSSVMRGHDSMMAVLSNRQRSLQIIYSLWHNKDLKAAIESAVAMNDLAVVVDLLGVLCLRPAIWNLDLCVALLPCIHDLLQSKYEMYMTVGCNTLRLILRNFAPVIKSNVQTPVQTLGVDISREERYSKCLKCYQDLMSIRAFLLKRQTMQGKLGHTFRELHILMQTLD